MRALAWDDKPEDYMRMLQESLRRHYNIDLEIADKVKDFIDRFSGGTWDFIIVDLIEADKQALGDEDRVGLDLSRKITEQAHAGRSLPIFMITNFYDRLKIGDLPPNVIPKSKSTHPGWMAGEIRQELAQRGVYVNRRKVFLIYGHDRHADGATGRVKEFLTENGLVAETISGATLATEIGQGLVSRMNECGAFVAVCTPDDRAPDGSSYPRLNVLLEIGIAMGLSRGLQRLIVLQKWGTSKEQQGQLPSDLGGLLPIRFEGAIESTFEALGQRLKALGVELAGGP